MLGLHPNHAYRFVGTADFDEEAGTGHIVAKLTDAVEIAANARLIAAAPDLLAACKALQSAWADGEVGDWRGALDDALTAADRAVRKAEGGVA